MRNVRSHFNNGRTMVARRLILNFGSFPWEDEAGFTIGLWFRTDNASLHEGLWSSDFYLIVFMVLAYILIYVHKKPRLFYNISTENRSWVSVHVIFKTPTVVVGNSSTRVSKISAVYNKFGRRDRSFFFFLPVCSLV